MTVSTSSPIPVSAQSANTVILPIEEALTKEQVHNRAKTLFEEIHAEAFDRSSYEQEALMRRERDLPIAFKASEIAGKKLSTHPSEKSRIARKNFSINRSERSREVISRENSKILQRFKIIKHVPAFVRLIFIVGSVVYALSPFIWADMPTWVPIVALLSMGVVVAVFVSPKFARLEQQVKDIESQLKFHEVFRNALEKDADPHIISEAEILRKDPKLESDNISGDLLERLEKFRNQETDRTLNLRYALYSTKDVRAVCDKFGLEAGQAPHRLAASRYSQSVYESERDFQRNLGQIIHFLEQEKLAFANQPFDSVIRYARNTYLPNVCKALKKFWLLHKNSKFSNADLERFFRLSLVDTQAQYVRRFELFQKQLEEGLYYLKELQLPALAKALVQDWEAFQQQKAHCPCPSNLSVPEKWAYGEYWDAKLVDFQKQKFLKPFAQSSLIAVESRNTSKEAIYELLSIRKFREVCEKAILEKRAKYHPYPKDDPGFKKNLEYIECLTNLEKKYFEIQYRHFSPVERQKKLLALQVQLMDLIQTFRAGEKWSYGAYWDAKLEHLQRQLSSDLKQDWGSIEKCQRGIREIKENLEKQYIELQDKHLLPIAFQTQLKELIQAFNFDKTWNYEELNAKLASILNLKLESIEACEQGVREIRAKYRPYPLGPTLTKSLEFQKLLMELEKKYYEVHFQQLTPEKKNQQLLEFQKQFLELIQAFRREVQHCPELLREIINLEEEYKACCATKMISPKDKIRKIRWLQDRLQNLLNESCAIPQCENEEKTLKALDDEYRVLCASKISRDEKFQKLKALFRKFGEVLGRLNVIGAKVTLQDIHGRTYAEQLKHASDVEKFPSAYSRDEIVLRNGLIAMDKRIMSQQQMRLISLLFMITTVVLGALYSGNSWIFASCVLGFTLSDLLQNWVRKDSVVKWEKKKQILKFAYYLIQNPLLMQERHLPPLPEAVIKLSRQLVFPQQKALLLSRAIMV